MKEVFLDDRPEVRSWPPRQRELVSNVFSDLTVALRKLHSGGFVMAHAMLRVIRLDVTYLAKLRRKAEARERERSTREPGLTAGQMRRHS